MLMKLSGKEWIRVILTLLCVGGILYCDRSNILAKDGFQTETIFESMAMDYEEILVMGGQELLANVNIGKLP